MEPSPHVLLLNASADESDMYAFWLETRGYRVTVAPDAATARRIARKGAVDVLVIDALFGAPAGRAEVERRWSRLAHRECLPIVVLSGFLTDAQEPESVPGEVCVLKPCPPQQLSSCIAHLLYHSPAGIRENT